MAGATGSAGSGNRFGRGRILHSCAHDAIATRDDSLQGLPCLRMVSEGSVLHALLKLKPQWRLVWFLGNAFVDVGGHETSIGERRFWLLASDDLQSVCGR